MSAFNQFSLAGIFVVTCSLLGCTQSNSVVLKDTKATDLVAVRTVALAQEQVQRTTLQPASIHAFYRAEVRAKASGFVAKLHADIGDYVETGAKLAIIDVPDLRMHKEVLSAQIKQREAQEQQAKSGIVLAQARVESTEAKLAEAKSQISGAEASVAAAQAQFDRTQDLVQRQSLQDRMLDESRKSLDSERAQEDAMRSMVNSAQAEIAVAKAQLVTAQADLDAAEAATDIVRRERDELQVAIDYATLKAPFSGIVTERNIEPGNLVRGENEVGVGKAHFVVSQVDQIRVRVPVPESDAPLVSPGDLMTLTFPSFADEPPLTAKITRTSGNLDPSTRTMMVEAEMPNADGKLLPGMFGQASINLSTEVAANMLPARAIRFDEAGNAYVYLLSPTDEVTVATITTGLDDGNRIEVQSGIQPGQRVIDSHLQRFTDGQKVKPL
jgi:RND family efflux transporter MFP subunit